MGGDDAVEVDFLGGGLARGGEGGVAVRVAAFDVVQGFAVAEDVDCGGVGGFYVCC